jgi:hypothetical protein
MRTFTAGPECPIACTYVSKLQQAFNALREAHDNVSTAKHIVAQTGVRISARTWAKAIKARECFVTIAAMLYVPSGR